MNSTWIEMHHEQTGETIVDVLNKNLHIIAGQVESHKMYRFASFGPIAFKYLDKWIDFTKDWKDGHYIIGGSLINPFFSWPIILIIKSKEKYNEDT